MKRTIMMCVLATACHSTTIRNPNGTFEQRDNLLSSTTVADSTAAYDRCMMLMASPAPGGPRAAGGQQTAWADVDRYCRNAATFGAPPRPGSPDQFPPQICGQNVICPAGVPDGYPKFNGMPPGGMPYQIMGDGYYGTMPWSGYSPYLGAMGMTSYLMSAGPGAHEYAWSIADPQAAGYAAANARSDATYPEAAKNPGDFARRSELRVVTREVHKLGDDIADTDADLQSSKKRHASKPAGSAKAPAKAPPAKADEAPPEVE